MCDKLLSCGCRGEASRHDLQRCVQTPRDEIAIALIDDNRGREMGREVYTVAEVATLTGFSVPTIIRMFEREPGVLILARPETMHKRKYRSIRVPGSIYGRA